MFTLKRITVFALFSGLLVWSLCGCGEDNQSSPQASSQAKEKEFAEIHKNVEFNQGDTAQVHGSSMTTEAPSYGGHGMSSPHGKKEKVDPNKVIATVNGEKILRKELDQILDRFRKQVDPMAIPSLEQQIMEQLITQAMLRQFVKEKNLTVAEEVVDKEIEKMRENIKKNPATKDKTLEQFLEIQGSNLDELKTAIRMSASLENYVAKDIDDKVLEEYFIKNINDFNGETVTASHILVDTKGMTTQEELDKARVKIESIKKELDEGADFAELAKKYSDCPTGKNGGNLGSFPRHGVMVESFANSAFATEVGTVSEPVKTEFGYHLIKVTEHTKPKDVSFSEVKDKVRQKLVAVEMNKIINELKAQADIEIDL